MVQAQGTILVVDDDAKNIKLLEALLQPRGYQVVTASNGAEALYHVRQEPPDLMLLDVIMPMVDGFEVCRLLKDNPQTRLIQVVIMTALDGVEDRIKGADAGADDFLTKPVHKDELLARIRTSLRRKQVIDATLDSLRRETLQRPPEVADTIFRQEGDYWTMVYHGTVCRLKDMKGLHYLAILLGHPGKEYHVAELVTAVDHPQASLLSTSSHIPRQDQWAAERLPGGGCGAAAAVLDAPAKAAYKRKLDELRDELTEAQRFHDLARATKAQAEIDFLKEELAKAVGLGGRDRRFESSAERVRQMVTKAMRAARDKIRDSHPALGHHLDTSITTGMFCTYTPDPSQPLLWTL
jgi:DNA-binding response OmpR family regulator